jgi:MinD-like ATPase involved in chromosome partitioning or flagellar assembly
VTGKYPGTHGLRILAITNQKGGVGKTTTAINLGTALAAVGENVLIIDLDPQGNASTGVGIAPEARHITSYDVMTGQASLSAARLPTAVPGLSIVSANSDLVGLESELMVDGAKPYRLRDAVTALIAEQRAKAGEQPFTYVLIDCPPSLNLLTLNAHSSRSKASRSSRIRSTRSDRLSIRASRSRASFSPCTTRAPLSRARSRRTCASSSVPRSTTR